MQSERSVRRLVAVAGLVAGCQCAWAGVDTSGYGPERINHISYVRSRPIGANGAATMITDAQYATMLRNTPVGQGGAVDVVMQQCFGGGFLDEIAAGGVGMPARRTFVSAAAYDEAALNADTVSRPARNGGAPAAANLSNFTRAYVEGQRFLNGAGLRPWYNLAKNGARSSAGNVLVAADEFAVSGPLAQRNREHPQYWSPDPSENAGLPRPNDFRTLHHLAAPAPTERQYGILISWAAEDRRHDLNIQRIRGNLTNLFNVPTDNLAVLVGNRVNGPALPGIDALGPIDPNGLAEVAVDGPNSLNAFQQALQGDFFKVNGVRNTALPQGQQANTPRAGDRIFIYNTGHGGHATIRNGFDRAGNAVRQFLPTKPANDAAGDGIINLNVRRGVANDPEFDNSFVDDSGMVRVQVTTDGPIDPAIFMTLNGVNPLGGLTPLYALTPLTSSEVLDITPLLGAAGMQSFGALHTYQMYLRFDLLENSQETGIPIEFGNVFGDEAMNSLLAITFASGDQEYSHVFVPAPGGALVAAAATMVATRRRRVV